MAGTDITTFYTFSFNKMSRLNRDFNNNFMFLDIHSPTIDRYIPSSALESIIEKLEN